MSEFEPKSPCLPHSSSLSSFASYASMFGPDTSTSSPSSGQFGPNSSAQSSISTSVFRPQLPNGPPSAPGSHGFGPMFGPLSQNAPVSVQSPGNIFGPSLQNPVATATNHASGNGNIAYIVLFILQESMCELIRLYLHFISFRLILIILILIRFLGDMQIRMRLK